MVLRARLWSIVLAALASVLVVCPAVAEPKADTGAAPAAPIVVRAGRIASFNRLGGPGNQLGKLQFRGGLVLSSDDAAFGGWSGLIVDDNARDFVAISDTGVWMTGAIAYDGSAPSGIDHARLGPLLNSQGNATSRKRDHDAEAVTLVRGTVRNGEVLIGFERKPRIGRFPITSDGLALPSGNLTLPAGARAMHRNQGFEAVTVIKGGPYKGSVLAFSERLYDRARNHTGWIWTAKGPQELHLKNVGDFDVTDAATLEDGTVFVLERRFRWLEGVKMRLLRIAPEDVGPGRTIVGDVLIEADLESEIDNMEGLSVSRSKTGDALITMISDDNFNHFLQRTLLLQFSLKADQTAKARPQE